MERDFTISFFLFPFCLFPWLPHPNKSLGRTSSPGESSTLCYAKLFGQIVHILWNIIIENFGKIEKKPGHYGRCSKHCAWQEHWGHRGELQLSLSRNTIIFQNTNSSQTKSTFYLSKLFSFIIFFTKYTTFLNGLGQSTAGAIIWAVIGQIWDRNKVFGLILGQFWLEKRAGAWLMAVPFPHSWQVPDKIIGAKMQM